MADWLLFQPGFVWSAHGIKTNGLIRLSNKLGADKNVSFRAVDNKVFESLRAIEEVREVLLKIRVPLHFVGAHYPITNRSLS
jgi:hypothetical protein